MIVETRQELKGPRGCRLHRVRVLISGRDTATADVDAATTSAATSNTFITGTGRVTGGIINAVAGDGGDNAVADPVADPVADLLSLHQRRYLLPL